MATASDPRPKPEAAPPPPPPPEHAQAKDKDEGKADYYGYLYDAKKTPTKTFDALLRAIGQHIIDHIGDKKDKCLKPSKLAAYYKAVGGDYDKLFVHAPQESIAYIWQVFGCRHSLQPTDNDSDGPWNFVAPSIPALTLRGFVRWESIQVLLTPEEHVPFILYAVRHWHLRHPDTDEPFPSDLTAAALPTEPDGEITAWYESCGEKLRKEATPDPSPRPTFPSQDRVHAAFSHVRAPGRTGTPDYFSHHRSVPFAHVSPGHAARTPRSSGLRVSPERMERPERMRYSGMSPQEERARRRSFSDYPSPHASPNEAHSSAHLQPPRPTATRRHSHPRRVSTEPDDSESDNNATPLSGRRGSAPYASGGSQRNPRFVHIAVPASGPPGGTSPAIPSGVPIPNIRTDGGAKLRADDRISPITSGPRTGRKGGVEGAKDWAKEKISRVFPIASPSERIPPRKSPSSSGAVVGGNASRDSFGRSRSYDEGNSESDSEYERERRRRRRRERERREREAATASYERERARRSREDMGPPSAEWEDGAGRPRSRKDRERYLRRPENPRRTSSHADIDRLERERMAHSRYDYADEGSARRRPPRGRGPLDDGGRDSPRDVSPVIKGVGGRRYPAPAESPP